MYETKMTHPIHYGLIGLGLRIEVHSSVPCAQVGCTHCHAGGLLLIAFRSSDSDCLHRSLDNDKLSSVVSS